MADPKVQKNIQELTMEVEARSRQERLVALDRSLKSAPLEKALEVPGLWLEQSYRNVASTVRYQFLEEGEKRYPSTSSTTKSH